MLASWPGARGREHSFRLPIKVAISPWAGFRVSSRALKVPNESKGRTSQSEGHHEQRILPLEGAGGSSEGTFLSGGSPDFWELPPPARRWRGRLIWPKGPPLTIFSTCTRLRRQEIGENGVSESAHLSLPAGPASWTCSQEAGVGGGDCRPVDGGIHIGGVRTFAKPVNGRRLHISRGETPLMRNHRRPRAPFIAFPRWIWRPATGPRRRSGRHKPSTIGECLGALRLYAMD